MKRWSWQLALLSGLILGGQAAHAGQVSLADWCVNINGDTSTACNGAGTGGASTNPNGGSTSLVNFDMTAEPGSNVLGVITVSLNAGAGQYVSFYSDYDVDFATLGSFDDSVSVHGALPAGYSYSVSDPNAFNGITSPSGFTLFDLFANNTLDNTNSAGVPAGPPDECCDVGWALAFSGIDVGPGGLDLTFVVSDVAPDGGFYLQQTNTDTNDSIFLSIAPEPSTFGLALGAMIAALFYARKRQRKYSNS